MLNVVRMLALSFLLLIEVNEFASAATFVWSTGMEGGNLNEWSLNDCGGEFNSGTADSIASQDHTHTGVWGAKMTISAPSESGTRLFRWCEPQNNRELYYSVWYYIPRQYSAPNYWNVFQWKSKVSSSQTDPFFVLNIGNRSSGNMYFYLYDWQQRQSYSQTAQDIPIGRWFQVEAFYRCAGDNTGRVTFWQDGLVLFDVNNVRTRYANGDCQWSVDNYSSSLNPSPATIYIDDAVISLTKIGSPSDTSLATPTNLQVEFR
jgi:hypothetical protein